MVDKEVKKVSIPALRRLPLYYHYMKKMKKEGDKYVSSTQIGKKINLKAIQVRKDLSIKGLVGKARVGFNVNEAIEKIEEFMGWKNKTDAIIVGCGDLGSALMGYQNFDNYGFEIVAGFDIKNNIIGNKIHEKKVFHLEKLKDLCNRLHIEVGIICVPAEKAQFVADKMIEADIKAIWNFAPATIMVPDDISLHNEDMAASLTILLKKYKNI